MKVRAQLAVFRGRQLEKILIEISLREVSIVT